MAILIALAAVVDPAITTNRATRPLVSLVSANVGRDSALLRQTERVLQTDFEVVGAPSAGAAATVVVGDQVPLSVASVTRSGTALVVSPNREASVSITRVQSPAFTTRDARATIVATMALTSAGSSANTLIELVEGGRIVAREQRVLRADSSISVPLTFVPSRTGAAVLQLRAFVDRQRDTTRTDLVIDVRDVRWSVLFFDRRPSWMSTFVRRALERDPRFAVTSRIVTSTNVSREQGRAPVSLESVAATSAFDVVVIGAPDALNTRDVESLRTLLRTRGASVMLLADRAASGPVDALTGTSGWRTVARRAPVAIVSDAARTSTGDTSRDVIRLQGLSIGVPSRLPTDADVIARLGSTTRSPASTNGDAVIWRVPVGLGHLLISGAFDSWRYRDSAQSTFDATWRDLVDEAARLRQPALSLEVSPALVEPREMVRVAAHRREDKSDARPLQLAWRRVQSTDSLESESQPVNTSSLSAPTPILSDSASRAFFPAPLDTGHHEVIVTDGIDTVYAPLVVAANIKRDVRDKPALARAWAVSRGGRVVSSDSLSAVSDVLRELVQPATQRITWHPMRSPWWIVPFALLLAAEWWIRRRRGLA